MAIPRLLHISRHRFHRRPISPLTPPSPFASSSHSLSTADDHLSNISPSSSLDIVTNYDLSAFAVNSKLKRLQNTDPRFLRYSFPHPIHSDHISILSTPETRVTTLPNGLRVATESNFAAKTVTIGVWLDAGSRYESDETNGVAHFLEHMVFKGTERRPVKVLEEEIENLGGRLDAYTSREQTAYYANVMAQNVPQALDILADILQNSVIDEEKIHLERA